MAITAISRDWGAVPSIVRMVSDDALSVVLGSTYLDDQADNIKALNQGAFDWQDTDMLLVAASDGKYLLPVAVSDAGVVSFGQASSVQTATYTKEADDGAASDTTAETPLFSPESGAVVLSVKYLPSAALTADNTNYATLSVDSRDAAGGSNAVIASITTEITGTGDWVAFVAEDFGTLANTAIVAGGAVTFAIAKAGTGVVVPAGALQVEYVNV